MQSLPQASREGDGPPEPPPGADRRTIQPIGDRLVAVGTTALPFNLPTLAGVGGHALLVHFAKNRQKGMIFQAKMLAQGGKSGNFIRFYTVLCPFIRFFTSFQKTPAPCRFGFQPWNANLPIAPRRPLGTGNDTLVQDSERQQCRCLSPGHTCHLGA